MLDAFHHQVHPVVGEDVVVHDHIVGYPDEREHERGHHAGAVLADRAVEDRGKVVAVGEMRDHLRQHLAPRGKALDVVTPEIAFGKGGRQDVARGGVAVGERRVEPTDARGLERTPSGALELDRGPQIDDGADPEVDEPIDRARCEVMERVAAEQQPRPGRATIGRRQTPEVPEVERPVKLDEAVLLRGHAWTVRAGSDKPVTDPETFGAAGARAVADATRIDESRHGESSY